MRFVRFGVDFINLEHVSHVELASGEGLVYILGRERPISLTETEADKLHSLLTRHSIDLRPNAGNLREPGNGGERPPIFGIEKWA